MRLSDHIRCQHIANVIFSAIVGVFSAIFKLYPLESAHRGFFCDDENIRYPYKKDTVPVWLVVVTCFIPIIALVLAVEIVYGLLRLRFRTASDGSSPAEEETRRSGLKHGLTRAFVVLATFMYGNGLCLIVTEVFKLWFGGLRPSFLSACKLETDVTSWANCSGLYVSDFKCTNSDSQLVRDMKKSFLSGHASFVAFNMLFIMLYVQLRLPSMPRLAKSLLQCAALVYGVFVCGSRITDNMHHPQDILAGVVLGVIYAWVTVFKICPRFMRSPTRLEMDTLPITSPSLKAHGPAVAGMSSRVEDKPAAIKLDDRLNSIKVEERAS